MEVKELVGEHILNWVHVAARNPIDKDAEAMIFSLDGVAYLVMEDPNDGYRSSMRELIVLGSGVYTIDDVWPERLNEKVICTHQTTDERPYHGEDDLLVMRSVATGNTVLTIGTSNIDDYYPSYTADFEPRNLAANAGKT